MAFDIRNLSEVRALGNNRWSWYYATIDPLAAVLAADYLSTNAGLSRLHVGDVLGISASGGAEFLEVSVSSVAGGSVVLEQATIPAATLPGQAVNKAQLDAVANTGGIASTAYATERSLPTSGSLTAADAGGLARITGAGTYTLTASGFPEGAWVDVSVETSGTVTINTSPGGDHVSVGGSEVTSFTAGKGTLRLRKLGSSSPVWLALFVADTIDEAGVSDGFVIGRLGGVPAWRSPANARSDLFGAPGSTPGSLFACDTGLFARAGLVVVASLTTASALYTAANLDLVPVNTTGGALANPPKLPASAAAGTRLAFFDSATGGSWAANALVVNVNGASVNGSGSNYSCGLAGARVDFYSLGSNNWIATQTGRTFNAGGVTTWTELSDAQPSYVGKKWEIIRVASGEGGQEFVDNPAYVPKMWLPSGAYYRPRNFTGSAGSITATQYTAYYFPVLIDTDATFTAVTWRVTTAVNLANWEVSLYPYDKTTGRPSLAASARVWTATAALSGTSAQTSATGAISWSPTPGWYFGRFICDTAAVSGQAWANANVAAAVWGYAPGTAPTAAILTYSKAMGSYVTGPSTAEDISSGWASSGTGVPALFLS